MSVAKPKSGGFSLTDLKRFFPFVRKNWWIVVLIGALSYGIGRLYTYKLNKVYSVTTQLLLKSNDDYSAGSLITDGRFYGNTYKTYIDNSNEMRVIQSQDLIEKTLDKLDFDVSYFLVGRLRTTEVYSGVPFSVKTYTLNPALYEQQIKFRIVSASTYELTYQIGDQINTVTGRFNEEFVNPHMRIKISTKRFFNVQPQVLHNSANYLLQPHRKEALIRLFLSNLTVENPNYTNIIKLSFKDVIPERGIKFLDTLSQVYINNTVTSRLDINQNTTFYIDRQMDEVVNILNSIEDTLQRFREDYSVIDLGRQSNDYFDKYAAYLNEMRGVKMQQATLDDLEQYVIEDKDPAFLPPQAYSLPNDQFQASTLSELYEKQKQLNAALNVATPNNFTIKDLKSQIDSTKRDLLIYIGNTRQALKEKTAAIQQQIDFYEGMLQTLPQKQRGLLNITRKQKVNEDMYLFLLQRRANTIISRASIVPETKIIEKSRLSGIVSPDENNMVLQFVAVGLILAVLIVLLRVLFFHRIESYDELKGLTQLPILGDVVLSKEKTELAIAVEYEPKSAMAESFRTIRTNLQYMAAGKGPHIIVITSNSPGEGKTFCSLNLAAVLAKTNKSTVLLELDLHKPRVQVGLGIKSEKGISTIAAGKHTIAECVVTTKIEGLDAILSGPLPPNPSEIISSQKMDEILEYCKAHYDYIIIDTPPVGLITDALVLTTKAAVLLFVMNTKFSYRSAINNAEEIAALNPKVHFGFILNGVKKKKSKYYYNRYGYGYGNYGGYGGGYGSYGGGGYGGYGSYGSYGGSRKPKKNKDSGN